MNPDNSGTTDITGNPERRVSSDLSSPPLDDIPQRSSIALWKVVSLREWTEHNNTELSKDQSEYDLPLPRQEGKILPLSRGTDHCCDEEPFVPSEMTPELLDAIAELQRQNHGLPDGS